MQKYLHTGPCPLLLLWRILQSPLCEHAQASLLDNEHHLAWLLPSPLSTASQVSGEWVRRWGCQPSTNAYWSPANVTRNRDKPSQLSVAQIANLENHRHGGAYKPLRFGVVCCTAKANWHRERDLQWIWPPKTCAGISKEHCVPLRKRQSTQ